MLSKRKYIADKKVLLRQFGIKITPEIIDRISELYPNDIAVENYTRTLILKYLENLEY